MSFRFLIWTHTVQLTLRNINVALETGYYTLTWTKANYFLITLALLTIFIEATPQSPFEQINTY